jgi:hypothetical protein
MKRYPSMRASVTTILLISTEVLIRGQGSFTNLGFEQGLVPQGPLPIPGWTAYIEEPEIPLVLVNDVGFNTISLGGAAIILHDSNSPVFEPLRGRYSVSLNSSFGGPPFQSAAIAQTGQVPADAQSLRFIAKPWYGLQVTFAGQVISITQVATSPERLVLGGDISAFAGQTGELRFTALPAVGFGGGLIDSIVFSSQPIPEPSTWLLLGVGGLGLLAGHRLRLRRDRTRRGP